MDILLGLVVNILEEGLIYGVMAMGVYITYKILDFPDLSVDGTFPLGACVTAVLITLGVNPWLACLGAFACGAAAGCVTGLLHVKLHISDLLSGILVMTGLYSINLLITGGQATVQFYNKPTIFTAGPAALLPAGMRTWRVTVVALVTVVIVKLLLDAYLRTKSGLLLRATGSNAQYVISLGRDPGKMKILGLAIGNGCAAMSGGLLSQQTETANIASGTGMMVMALASVIIGTSLFRRVRFVKATAAVVLGSILYKTCLVVAMQLGLPEAQLPLAQAAVLLATAPKSNSASAAIAAAMADVKNGRFGDVPDHLKDAHYAGAEKMGRGLTYRYPHDFPGNYVAQQYLPDALKNADYYHEGANKAEQQAREYWKRIKGSPS